MNRAWPIAAWICIALVAMPMSPCAMLPQACAMIIASRTAVGDDHATAPSATQPAKHACCADEAEGRDGAKHKEPASPCPRGCCRLSPVAPKVDKVDPGWHIGLAAFLPWTPAVASDVDTAPAQEPPLPAQTLQSLLCLWRC